MRDGIRELLAEMLGVILAGDLLDPADAHELRRRMAAAHGFGVHTFNAGVMVLDLDRMRRDRFVELLVPMAGRFGLHDQDVLNAYTGPHRAELDPRWNSFPVAESLPIRGSSTTPVPGSPGRT